MEDVEEHAFSDYKAEGAELGWGRDTQHLDCSQCGASTEVADSTHATSCTFCGAAQIVESERKEKRRPESLLPFQVPRSECDDVFRAWVKKLWFRPNALKTLARPDELNGMYIPFWTYDALTRNWWNAESGTYYYVTESYSSNGQRKTRQVRKTRWTWVSGTHDAFYDDVLISASHSVPKDLIRGIEPFDTKALTPYQPEILAGMGAENYQTDMLEAWPEAKSRIDEAIYDACSRRIPGNTHRNLTVSSHYSNKTYKLCLLPIWIANYRFRGKIYRYLVNGHSGTVHGEAPLSWPKVVGALLALGGVITAIATYDSFWSF